MNGCRTIFLLKWYFMIFLPVFTAGIVALMLLAGQVLKPAERFRLDV